MTKRAADGAQSGGQMCRGQAPNRCATVKAGIQVLWSAPPPPNDPIFILNMRPIGHFFSFLRFFSFSFVDLGPKEIAQQSGKTLMSETNSCSSLQTDLCPGTVGNSGGRKLGVAIQRPRCLRRRELCVSFDTAFLVKKKKKRTNSPRVPLLSRSKKSRGPKKAQDATQPTCPVTGLVKEFWMTKQGTD